VESGKYGRIALIAEDAGDARDDKVVSRPATENYFKSLALQNKKLKIYDGYYHEIYNEVGRDEPFTDLTNWISSLI
jgi:alpha-beta hydrolase superfamily lysophospholipase